jgi:hypothetical protein
VFSNAVQTEHHIDRLNAHPSALQLITDDLQLKPQNLKSRIMKRALAGILLILWQSLTLAWAQEAEWCISKHGESGAAPCFNLPDWVLRVAQSAKFPAEYDLSHHLNPYFQSGDFDADGKLDVAVLVRQKSTGRSGIAIFLYGKTKPVVLGAGRSFGNGGTDFSWMDNWSVYSKAAVRKSPWEDKPPAPRGDALWVGKSESASAFIFWDGRKYVWYQQSD